MISYSLIVKILSNPLNTRNSINERSYQVFPNDIGSLQRATVRDGPLDLTQPDTNDR